MLVTEWAWSVGVALAISVLLHSLHVPSYGGMIWLKHEEIETNFLLGIKGLRGLGQESLQH